MDHPHFELLATITATKIPTTDARSLTPEIHQLTSLICSASKIVNQSQQDSTRRTLESLNTCTLVPLRVSRHPNDQAFIFQCDNALFPSAASTNTFPYMCLDDMPPGLAGRVLMKLSLDKCRQAGKLLLPQADRKVFQWPQPCSNVECMLRCKRCLPMGESHFDEYRISQRQNGCVNDMCVSVGKLVY